MSTATSRGPSRAKAAFDAWDAAAASRIRQLLASKKELPDPKAYEAWAAQNNIQQQRTQEQVHQMAAHRCGYGFSRRG